MSVGGSMGQRTRRASVAHRRDSVRPSRSPSGHLTPSSVEIMPFKEPETPESRRHRRIAMILLAIFLFILAAAILAVIVTLTHSSFHQPPLGSRELAEHRANVIDLRYCVQYV